jgi:hypothetical protein
MLSNSESKKTTYVKMFSREPGTKDANAFFGISEKVDGQWKTTTRFDTLEGYLDSISVGEFIFDGKSNKTVKMLFTSADGERVQIESTFTLLAYSAINSIAGCDLSKQLKLKLYVRTRKDNGEKNAAIFIECGGEKSNWKYAPEELPKIVKVMVGKKEVIDDSEVVEFYEKLIAEVNAMATESKKTRSTEIMMALPNRVTELPKPDELSAKVVSELEVLGAKKTTQELFADEEDTDLPF